MAKPKKEESKKIFPEITGAKWRVLFIFIAVLTACAVLGWFQYKGIVDVTRIIPHFMIEKDLGKPITQQKCAETSAEMGKPCCKQLENGEMVAAVSAIYVQLPCKCPVDTEFLMMAPEGNNIQICDCKC